MFIIALTIYVLVHTPSGDSVRSYEGQSLEVVTNNIKREGKTFHVISQKEFNSRMAATMARQSTSNSLKEQTRRDVNNKQLSTDQRLDALIKYLGLQ